MAESKKRSGSEELERNVTINVGDTSALKVSYIGGCWKVGVEVLMSIDAETI